MGSDAQIGVPEGRMSQEPAFEPCRNQIEKTSLSLERRHRAAIDNLYFALDYDHPSNCSCCFLIFLGREIIAFSTVV